MHAPPTPPKKEVYYVPGYAGHVKGIKSDGLNIGQTTTAKLVKLPSAVSVPE